MAGRIHKTGISLILAAVFFVALVAICRVVLPGASGVTLVLQADQPVRIQLFYSNGVRKNVFQEKHSVIAREIQPGRIEKAGFSLGSRSVNRVRLDFEGFTGTIHLHSITVTSHLARTVTLNPSDIKRLFTDHHDVLLAAGEDVAITAIGADPYIVSNGPLLAHGLFLGYGLPLLAAVVLYFILQGMDFCRFPPFADIGGKRPTTGRNIVALDGLRGLAVIMVVADHCWGRFTGLGAGGVWLFMSLSGFLLARPFVQQPERAVSVQFLSHFFIRRIQRIVPAYYLFILISYLFQDRFDEALRHFLFLQGNAHLWVVPQEMLFYLLVPPLMAVNYLVLQGKPLLIILNLTLLMVLANCFVDADVFSLYGMRYQNLRAYIGIFFAGVITSYLYYGFYQPRERVFLQKYNMTRLFSALSLLLLLFFLLGSTERVWGGDRVFAQLYFGWFGVAAGTLIFVILTAKQSMVNRLLSSKVLRAISIVSFSLYLFHPLVLNCIKEGVFWYFDQTVSGFLLFALTLMFSYGLACLLYTYIERPFIHSSSSSKDITPSHYEITTSAS